MAEVAPTHLYDMSPGKRAAITVAVILAMLMQVLDTTIANVALPHMQTSLGATRDTVNWVLTSYIVASAIAIPITGWLADRVGRKPLFVWSVIVFTIASMLCAAATSLEEMVLFRILQGIAGAFLVPLAQAVMFDINRPENHGRAMALFGAGVMVGPILGPVLGGWLTDNFNWRWVFLVNLPIGILATLMLLRFLPVTKIVRRRFDLFGFALLALALGGLQMMLDRGEQVDWFDSWEIWIETGLFLAGAWMFVIHMLTSRAPLFDSTMFRDRNFVTGMLFMAITGVMLLAGLALLPPMLQGLFGYSVLQSGFLTAPRGVGTLISMIVVGRLVGRVDARVLIFVGLALMAVSLWQMSGFSLEMDRRPIIVSGVIQGFSLGFLFVPLNALAFGTLDARFRTTAASLLNLARNVGGSIGISVVSVLLARNLQISHADLAAHVTPASLPPVDPAIGAAQPLTAAAAAMLDAEVNRQALMIAYIDDFHLMMIVTLAAIPLLLLLRKARAGGGTPVMAD
jgi:DHA2 family multidrug resistance protein